MGSETQEKGKNCEILGEIPDLREQLENMDEKIQKWLENQDQKHGKSWGKNGNFHGKFLICGKSRKNKIQTHGNGKRGSFPCAGKAEKTMIKKLGK